MLQLDGLSSYEWQSLHAGLDRAVADAALTYMRRLHIQRVSGRYVAGTPERWGEELDELRLRREPDYDMPGVPLVYALRYMVRRVISISGALSAVSGGRYPTTVLDVGSGTGASAVAIDLMNMPGHISLLGVEPNKEMIAFAESFRPFRRVSARYLTGSFADLADVDGGLKGFDLVVFSAAFPYGFDEWSSVADAIGNYPGSKDKLILAIEPEAKSGLLDEFQSALQKRGWPTGRFCCHDLSELMKQDLPLPEITSVLTRLGSPGSPSQSWWSPPDDRFLIANPSPSWPSSLTLRLDSGGTLARALAQVGTAGARV